MIIGGGPQIGPSREKISVAMKNLAETATVCRVRMSAVCARPVDNEPWQRRLKRAGLNQTDLARLVGITPTNVSKALRGQLKGGVPLYLINFIRAWEHLSLDARDKLLAVADVAEDETSAAYKLQKPGA